MIYLVTGQPGTGKSTLCVAHAIQRYASHGRRVVANFPIDFAPICNNRKSKLSAASCYVIPDRPSRADLDMIGFGSEHQREETFGLLIIDEAGVWLSARSWQGTAREEIIDWLSQSRKRCWDIMLVAQGPEMIDKQVRNAICEGVVRIRRLDRVKIAGVSLPRVHVGICRYGVASDAPVLERWFYRGTEAHQCFGSYRIFGTDTAHYHVPSALVSKWSKIPPFDWAGFWRTLGAAIGIGPYAGAKIPRTGWVAARTSQLAAKPVGHSPAHQAPSDTQPMLRGPQMTPLARSLAEAFGRAAGGGAARGLVHIEQIGRAWLPSS